MNEIFYTKYDLQANLNSTVLVQNYAVLYYYAEHFNLMGYK